MCGKRYVSAGVHEKVDFLLQLFMWSLVENLPPPKDYLQVFRLSPEGNKQKIKHQQEEPDYEQEYLLKTDAPIFIGKIYVIDDGEQSTMLLAEEY